MSGLLIDTPRVRAWCKEVMPKDWDFHVFADGDHITNVGFSSDAGLYKVERADLDAVGIGKLIDIDQQQAHRLVRLCMERVPTPWPYRRKTNQS